jgi:hypothetical protein
MDRTRESAFLRVANSVRDPIPDAIADSIWLGGEAMVAPSSLGELVVAHEDATIGDADPSWLVI